MMAYSIRRPGLALWGAWLVAGVAGSLLPVLPAAFNLRFPIVAGLGLDDAPGFSSALVGAICLALFQTIVLGALKARFSASVLMWIPVSTGATVVAYLAIALWQVTVPRTVISVSAIGASLPPGFPLLQVILLSSVSPSLWSWDWLKACCWREFSGGDPQLAYGWVPISSGQSWWESFLGSDSWSRSPAATPTGRPSSCRTR